MPRIRLMANKDPRPLTMYISSFLQTNLANISDTPA